MQLVALGRLGFHGVIVLVRGELAAGLAAGIHGDGGDLAFIRGVVYVEGGPAQCVCRVAVSQARCLGALGELDVHIEYELPFSGTAALVGIGAWHGARCAGRCVLAFDQHEVRAVWVSLCLKRICAVAGTRVQAVVRHPDDHFITECGVRRAVRHGDISAEFASHNGVARHHTGARDRPVGMHLNRIAVGECVRVAICGERAARPGSHET